MAFFILPLFLFSCKKEGCTDPMATNFNSKAQVNNGSCIYNNPNNNYNNYGNLVVNVRDGSGNSVIGYYVYLYNNQADFNNVIYSQKKVTDNSGQVKFTNLSPGVYYVDCDYTTMSNNTVTVTGSGSVSAGYETTITIKP